MSYVNSASIQSGGTFTAGAGSNRRVIACGFVLKDTGTPTWSATFGGVSMTLDLQSAYVGDVKFLLFSLAEASIPSGSQTFTVTPAGGTALDNFYGDILTVSGRDQATALEASDTGSGTAATSLTTASLTNTLNAFLVSGIRVAPADTIVSNPSGWTHDVANTTSQLADIDYKDDSAANTGTYTWTLGGTDDFVYGVCAYKAASAAAAPILESWQQRGAMGVIIAA